MPISLLSGANRSLAIPLADLRLLLNEINTPCALVRSSNQTTLCVNSLLTQLTGISDEEFGGQPITSFLSPNLESSFQDGLAFQSKLERKGKASINIEGRLTYISREKELALFSINTSGQSQFAVGELPNKILAEAGKLIQQIPASSWIGTIRLIESICVETLASNQTVLYWKGSQAAELTNLFQGGKEFPQALPLIELKKTTQIDYWQPGKRVMTELQRVGRMKKYQSVISIPLFIRKEAKGIMGLAYREENREVELLPILPSFVKLLEGLLALQLDYDDNKLKYEDDSSESDQFARFFDHASDCALILDKDLVILDFNSQASQVLNYSPYELMNRDAREVFEGSELIPRLIAFSGHETVGEVKPLEIYDRKGNHIPVTYEIIPLLPEDCGKFLLILQDASAKVEAEKRMREIEVKAGLGEVVADFAHEARNPINNISTGLQLVKKRIKAVDASTDVIDRILDDCLRLNDLMESILSYSRQRLDTFKQINLQFMLQRILSRNQLKFQQNNISFKFFSEDQISEIKGDQRSLEQAFTNLITNAYEAIKGDGGVISVTINSDKPDWVEVLISDTGPGIPPEIKEKLFEPFVTDKPKGTGLGLAITKRMIEAHQGKIVLETFPGGTFFKVLLPAIPPQGETA